jgi:hypothetical protein
LTHYFLDGEILKDGSFRCNWHTDPTFHCNGKCPDCTKMLGVLPWTDEDPHVTLDDIKVTGKILRRLKIKVRRLRVQGGEPLMHPQFTEMFRAFEKEWEVGTMRVHTNGILKPPFKQGRTFRTSPMSNKRACHTPAMWSPADLGIEPTHGVKASCGILRGCGRTFDCYGFAQCLKASTVGRMIGVDVHSPYPVLQTDPKICRHCNCSATKQQQREVHRMVAAGEVEYPTETFRDGMRVAKKFGPEEPGWPRFLKRLAEFEDVDKLKGD